MLGGARLSCCCCSQIAFPGSQPAPFPHGSAVVSAPIAVARHKPACSFLPSYCLCICAGLLLVPCFWVTPLPMQLLALCLPHISYLMFLFAQSCYGWRGKEEGTGTLPSHLHLPAPRRARLTSRHDSHSWKWDGAGGQGVSVGEKCLCRKYSKWGKLACLLML